MDEHLSYCKKLKFNSFIISLRCKITKLAFLRVCSECNERGFPELLASRTIHRYSFVECCDSIRVVQQLEGEMHVLVAAAVKPDNQAYDQDV